jgi:cell division protein FtsB
MITRHRRKSAIRGLWMPLATVAFLGYFGFHAFNGSFGLWALDRLDAEASRLSAELQQSRADRLALERQVAAVRPASLDADVIDMAARDALNLMRPDEIVIEIDAAQQSPD